ncbi:Sodium/hydrogen exchanger family-domain-containing protein [Lipomyces arxii]|uniref:Sodium/hydrogen exchanger family-domain-containing protein n=1 Tax=Lipomyces arxii TaxID=56418 RepID=UPI0034CF481B
MAGSSSGVFSGMNPTAYSATDPLMLFVIQLVIIVVFCRLLHYPLSLLRQPRVIAEVIGGVLLGPSVMGRIPNFNEAIFPTASMPLLTLVANIGLVFFLFLVGLELDLSLVRKNFRISGAVALAGMALPFGLGVAVSVGLYKHYHLEADDIDTKMSFGLYALFVGVAMAITAFPVLARILTELKLLSTNVGTVVLSAGVTNDVVGWILLALTVALVNSSSGIVALYVFLVSVGWILFLIFAIKPLFRYAAQRTGSLENGPTQLMMVFTLLLVLISAFFTDMIGVHAIFGGFLAGLVVPHEHGFAVKVTEKVEDIITLLFLPLYFALSGLKTNLGLLDDGLTWGYTIAIISIAMISKITGGTVAAKLSGMLWRESFTVGSLMSCKGLVELIVLNVGLQAGILSERVFTMFVVMALLCTFFTTPITMMLYPPWYQKKVAMWRRGEIQWDQDLTQVPLDLHDERASSETVRDEATVNPLKMLTILSNSASVPATMALLQLFAPVLSTNSSTSATHPGLQPEKLESVMSIEVADELTVHGLRIEELTDRESAIVRATEEETGVPQVCRDVMLQSFLWVNKFWGGCRLSGSRAIIPEYQFAGYSSSKASDMNADVIVVPWRIESATDFSQSRMGRFVRGLLDVVSCDTIVFLDRGFCDNTEVEHMAPGNSSTELLVGRSGGTEFTHIMFPYLGSADDEKLLSLLCARVLAHPNVTATILHATPDLELPERYLDRIVVEQLESIDEVRSECVRKAQIEIVRPSDVIVVGRDNVGLEASESFSASSSSEKPPGMFGEFVDCVLNSVTHGSFMVYRAN